MHQYFDFGLFTLPAMGVCILIGTLIALAVLFFIRRYSVLSADDILDGIIWAVLIGFLLAKVLFWIVEPEAFTLDFSSTGAFFESLWSLIGEGMVFYGGLIGGVGALALVARRKKKGFFTYCDLFAPCFCLAHAGGRFGCYFSGCCYGMECVSPISINYPVHGEFALRLPTQLMEAGFLIILAVSLIIVLKKSKRTGTVTAWYLLLYSVWRFIIEFFRGDPRGAIGALSTSQFISLFIFAGGVLVLILSRKWEKPVLPSDVSRETANGEPDDAADDPQMASDSDESPARDPVPEFLKGNADEPEREINEEDSAPDGGTCDTASDEGEHKGE
ncbi:MAG: prolipoprotein diacylglyceryl transferase [Clostridia bacterium]|nr:prolipoprotein diacylglyceryl transferase [Clostridia bacterium]